MVFYVSILFSLFILQSISVQHIAAIIKTFCSGYVVLQVACMQFINIVVHSVEDMNFRVHLQYDFTKLGLDEYLDVSNDLLLMLMFSISLTDE